MKKALYHLAWAAVFVIAFFLISRSHAQEPGTIATGLPGLSGLSVQGQMYVTWALLIFKYASEFYSTVRNGGGLKRIFTAFWLGEQTPKVIADDYKAELQTSAKKPDSA